MRTFSNGRAPLDFVCTERWWLILGIYREFVDPNRNLEKFLFKHLNWKMVLIFIFLLLFKKNLFICKNIYLFTLLAQHTAQYLLGANKENFFLIFFSTQLECYGARIISTVHNMARFGARELIRACTLGT